MTISTRIRSELFATPPGFAGDCSVTSTPVKLEASSPHTAADEYPQLIRLPLTRPPGFERKKTKKAKRARRSKKASASANSSTQTLALSRTAPSELDYCTPHRHGLPWTVEEHDKFLQGLERFPLGPWKAIATFVGTRTPRQTMTHAQKYRQKIQRRKRGLLTSSSLTAAAAETPVKYEKLMVDTCVSSSTTTAWAPFSLDCDSDNDKSSKSPVAVDSLLQLTPCSPSQQLAVAAPLENEWFENVHMEELDAAFSAFLDEVYDPELMDPKDAWMQPQPVCGDAVAP